MAPMSATVDLPLLELTSDSGETFPVNNPATGETIAEVPRMGAAETRRALARAEEALPAWRSLLAKDRARILRRWADLMLENEEGLARLLTTEQGKPLAESRTEVAYAASFYEWFGEEGKRIYGDTIPTYAADRRIVVTKGPIGVTAGITPWNFPAAMPTRKSAPALAAGCTMVLKPAEQTPLSALAIAQLGREAGLPEGVFQIVTGAAEDAPLIGGELTSNHIVRKLGFTGSTEIGKLLMAQCAKQIKKVSLELGGNAPFIVFDDADLEEAIAGALICKFRNSGQTCISANRILVQDGIYDAAPVVRTPADILPDCDAAALDVDAVGGGAGLAHVAHLRRERGVDGGVEVGVVEDDEGRVAAQFHRGAHDGVRGLGEQCLADGGGAGERQLPQDAAAHDRLDHLRGAGGGDDVQDAVGHPGLTEDLREQQGGERGLRRGLEHDGAAGRQGGADLAGSHGEREVPGRDE